MGVVVHEWALCGHNQLGDGSRVGAFTQLSPGAQTGDDCRIGSHVQVDDEVSFGHRVTVQDGARVQRGVRLADDVLVGPNVVVGESTSVGPGAVLAAGAVLAGGVVVGRRSQVSAGAVVTLDVPPNAIVEGNPARIVGYVDAASAAPETEEVRASALPVSRIPGVDLVPITRADDLRGSLVAANFGTDLPFVPQRFFTVFGVPSGDVRGAHAHRRCHQLLVCVQGSINAVVDDGARRQEFVLDRPDVGLHMHPMIWGTQYRYSTDAVLLVLASDPYDAGDYIRDHDTFLDEVAGLGDSGS